MPTPKRMRARVGQSDMNFMMLKDGKWGDGGKGELGEHTTFLRRKHPTRSPAASGGGEWKWTGPCSKSANPFNKPIRST
jgi:hypothetical protein